MPPPWPAFAFPTGDSAAGDNVGKQALCHGDHWSPDHVAVPNFSRSQRRWNSSGLVGAACGRYQIDRGRQVSRLHWRVQGSVDVTPLSAGEPTDHRIEVEHIMWCCKATTIRRLIMEGG